MASISSLNSDDPYEKLIASMVSIERQPQAKLQSVRDDKAVLKGIMSDMDSKVSALHTLLKGFTDPFSSSFKARSASQPSSGAFKVTASDEAALGSHSLAVERLASTDTRISSQRTATSTALSTAFAGKEQSFSMQVGSPTTEDPNNRVDVAVTFTPQGTTDEEVLKELSTAIKDAMAGAVESGTIKSQDAASASIVKETSGTARLSLRSGGTGFANRLGFTDSSDGLLAAIELNNEAVALPGGGGQVFDVGTSEQTSALNSKFTLDGLTLYRSSNTVSDAVDGLSLTLSKAGEPAESFGIDPGTDTIKSKVQDFISKYNSLVSHIVGKTSVDGDTGDRAVLANDSLFTGLRYGLRSDLAQGVSGLPEGAPSTLADLGIETKRDGTLSLSSDSKLTSALQKDSGSVAAFFTGENGLATRLQNRLDAYVGSSGLMKSRKDSVDTQIKRLDTQIKAWDTRMASRETELRNQFAVMQTTLASLQSQQSSLSSYFYSMGLY